MSEKKWTLNVVSDGEITLFSPEGERVLTFAPPVEDCTYGYLAAMVGQMNTQAAEIERLKDRVERLVDVLYATALISEEEPK